MNKGYVIIIWNDHAIYPSRIYARRSDAEARLAEAKVEWADRYGEDAFEDHGDADEVAVEDGPYARLHELDVVEEGGGG